MDGDRQREEIKILENRITHARNFLQSTWLRRTIQNSDGLDRFLLDYGFTFLPRISAIFWIILYFKQA